MCVYIYIYTHTHTHTYVHTQRETHTHTMENYLAIKQHENFPFATSWMNLEGIMLSKMSDRERQILYIHHLDVELKK